jgi:hypothetical protein
VLSPGTKRLRQSLGPNRASNWGDGIVRAVTCGVPRNFVWWNRRRMSLKVSIKERMLRLKNLEGAYYRLAFAVIILIVVCALAVSVATRYSSDARASASRSKSLHQHSSPEFGRQRLTKDAAAWVPPVIISTALLTPSFYPRVSPAGPPIDGLQFEKSLYNRPPPSSLPIV